MSYLLQFALFCFAARVCDKEESSIFSVGFIFIGVLTLLRVIFRSEESLGMRW